LRTPITAFSPRFLEFRRIAHPPGVRHFFCYADRQLALCKSTGVNA
jgi:hypothetical protein